MSGSLAAAVAVLPAALALQTAALADQDNPLTGVLHAWAMEPANPQHGRD